MIVTTPPPVLTETVAVRVTLDEKRAIRREARRSGQTMSEWGRPALVSKATGDGRR